MRTAEFCSLSQTFTIFRSNIESKVVFRKEKNIEFVFPKTPFLGPNTHAQKTKPRLFSTKKESNYPNLIFNHGVSDARLYGIAYDATWRQVEEFQEFLFYLWEQSFYYESSIPYYAFTKPIEKHKQEIPRHEQSYAIQTGGYAFQHILSYLDGVQLQKELATHYIQLQRDIGFIHERITALDLSIFEDRKEFKRLRIKLNRLHQLQLKCKRQIETFRDFEQAKMQPAWMILSYLPVLPPGLRPITSIRGELIVSDINSLYRKVLIRNKRITRGANFGVFDTALSGSWLSWCYNIRQVQEAVDELLKTGSIESGKPLKSLLEGLKGKQGRFRQHLLGKRVDYSGRSVIVVGPKLQIHQCGLPKQMAIELFQPFIIQKLRKKGIVFTTTAAKALIAERKPIIWSILGEILKTHPILLNRAPTLHRLGIQAFLPQLVEGKAILLHPLVCPAFNADFDGDQMAVHVPLSAATRAEALDLLWARNHLLAPASGQPLLLPTQDMVLGFYYLTCSQEKIIKGLESLIPSRKALLQNQPFSVPLPKTLFSGKASKTNLYFSNFSQVKNAYDRGLVTLHTPIWVKWSGFIQTFMPESQTRTKEAVIELRLNRFGRGETVFLDSCDFFNQNDSISKPPSANKTSLPSSWLSKKSHFTRTTPGRVLMHSWIFQSNQPMGAF
jgi:DNA-directed RNA polymerase beta' subunit